MYIVTIKITIYVFRVTFIFTTVAVANDINKTYVSNIINSIGSLLISHIA